MKRITLLLLSITIGLSSLQAQTRSSKKASETPVASSEYNTTVYYNDNMSEVKSKGAYYLLINMGGNGLPVGKAKLYKAKENLLVWEGEYFLFNRVEPAKSKYQNLCTWYWPNGQKMRESNFRDGALDGKTTLYTETGKPSYTGNYKAGKLQGLWSYTDESGATGKAYYQQFDLMYDAWENFSKDGTATVANDALVIHSNTKDGYAVREMIPIETGRDFSIEVEFKMRASEALFMYGQKDTANYFGVTVSNKGTIRLDHVVGGVDKGSPQTFKVSMNKDANLLRIIRMGDDVFISMNGNMVTSYKYSRFYGNYFGVYVPSKNGEVYLYSVIAKEMKSKGGTSRQDAEVVETPAEHPTTKPGNQGQVDGAGWKPAGTGVFIASGGLIVTSYKVIEGANAVGVTQMSNGKRSVVKAKVLATDPQNDLAILKVEDLKFITPGQVPFVVSTAPTEVGESIFTLGYPLSNITTDEMSLADGVISARSGNGDSRVYQVSTPVNSGNAGGPVFDKAGNLLGINSLALSKGGNNVIKSSLIINLLQSLETTPKMSTANALKGKALKDQIRVLRNFVPIICVN